MHKVLIIDDEKDICFLISEILKDFVPIKLLDSLLEMSPYILTVIILAGFVGKAVAPKAIGQPFSKEK